VPGSYRCEIKWLLKALGSSPAGILPDGGTSLRGGNAMYFLATKLTGVQTRGKTAVAAGSWVAVISSPRRPASVFLSEPQGQRARRAIGKRGGASFTWIVPISSKP